MSRIVLIAALFVAGCTGAVDNLAARYTIEMNACVEVSKTRAEYEQCKQSVKERYAKEWNNVD